MFSVWRAVMAVTDMALYDIGLYSAADCCTSQSLIDLCERIYSSAKGHEERGPKNRATDIADMLYNEHLIVFFLQRNLNTSFL